MHASRRSPTLHSFGDGARIPVVAALVLAMASSAHALINPNFTPIHLVDQAKIILKVTLKVGPKGQTVLAQVGDAYKPTKNAPSGVLKIDLTAAPHEAQSEAVAKMVAAHPNEPALLFAGEFEEEGEFVAQELPEGFLHFAGRWVGLYNAKGGGYEMDEIDSHMEGTWAGSTDMLARAIRYILKVAEEATVPITGEASWDFQEKADKIAGKVHAAIPVELDDGLKQYLFVAAEKGDRLYLFDEKQKNLVDVTGKHKLAGKSRQAVWGDFNHDGRGDLASWDGKALSVHLRQADGTFRGRAIPADGVLKKALAGGCLGLAVVDSGREGRPALLVSTTGWPLLLACGADGKWSSAALGSGVLPAGADFGEAGACVAADLDGDALPDVLQMFSRGGLFYKGKAVGKFDKSAPCQIGLGKGRSRSFLGDYDSDGLLDVFAVAEDRPRLWHNLGGGKFVEMLGYSGEIAYISKPGGVDGATGDINNDGRQDVLIMYGANLDLCPQIFFNRGFRSFGHAHKPLDLAEQSLLPAAEDGQQAGCLADLNGDGAQDMAVVLQNGELWVFYRKVFEDEAALSVRVSLPLKKGFAGPLTVVGFGDQRCLGAWNVVAGSQVGFVGQQTAGPCVVKWRLPGGKWQQKEIVLVDAPVRFVVPLGK